jgi:hypothetical protein
VVLLAENQRASSYYPIQSFRSYPIAVPGAYWAE